jgi:hypothetical protein
VRPPRALPYVLLFAGYAALPAAIRWAAPSTPPELIPSFALSVGWAIPLFILAQLRNPFNRLVGLAWVAWYLIGSVNVVASFYVYGKPFQMDVERADLIYLVSTTAFLLGLLTAERIRVPRAPQGPSSSATSPAIASDRFAPPVSVLLLVFPILFAWSMHRALGYFPILQGVDITREIYELDYGRLYGYTVILVFSLLFVVDRLSQARSAAQRAMYAFLLAAFLLVSVLDGKRLTLIIFLVSTAAYLLRVMRLRLRRVALAGALITVGVALYVGVFVIRKGFQVERYKLAAYQFSSIGDEYRDFVYSVNEYAPGEIPGYRWLRSGIFAGLNSTTLAALGVNKHEEAIHGSAYVWQTLLGSNYGVRTGIVSELYFAYGWMSLWVVVAFGILTGWLGGRLEKATKRTTLMFLSSIYGILLVSVMGQTTVTTGALSIVLYLYVLSLVLQFVAHANGRNHYDPATVLASQALP